MLYKVNEKEPYASKQAISLNLVGTDKIVISDRFKHSNIGSKYSIGQKQDETIRPSCIILAQMSG